MDDPPRLRRRGAGSSQRCGLLWRRRDGVDAKDRQGGASRAVHMPSTRRRRRRVCRTREGAPTAWPDVRVKPAEPCQRRPRASSRPRRPDDAKATFKTANVFLHPPKCLCGRVGRGLFRRRLRHVLGHRWRGYKRPRTRPSPICRGLKLTERPRKSAVQADFRWPHAEETSPCPPCRRQGRAQREAQDPHSKHDQQHQHLEAKRKSPAERGFLPVRGAHEGRLQVGTQASFSLMRADLPERSRR